MPTNNPSLHKEIQLLDYAVRILYAPLSDNINNDRIYHTPPDMMGTHQNSII